MTKAQIIEKLHSYGEWWANESYTKKELEAYLNDCEIAKNMTDEELRKMLGY